MNANLLCTAQRYDDEQGSAAFSAKSMLTHRRSGAEAFV
jgi:hypothetical protein